MTSFDHLQAPLDADMEKQRAELADIIRRVTTDDGNYATAVDSLFMSRYSKSHDFASVLAQPALCIMAQGRKEVRLSDEIFNYDPLNYLVVSVSMPLSGRVVNVTSEEPILAVRLDIDPAEITALIADAGLVRHVVEPRVERGAVRDHAMVHLVHAGVQTGASR